MLIYKIKFVLHLFCHTEFHKREEIEMDFYNRLQELAKKKGKSFHQIEVDLGYSKNSFYNYKTKKPTADNLNKIAEYFGVTSDYLLGNTDTPEPPSSQLEENINKSFQYKDWTITPDEKESVQDFIEIFFETENYRKTLGYRIKKIREKIDISKKDFALSISSSLTAETVEEWENNSIKPQENELEEISKLGNVSLKYLLTGKHDLLSDPILEMPIAQVSSFAEQLNDQTYNKLVSSINDTLNVLIIMMEGYDLVWQDLYDINFNIPNHKSKKPLFLENLDIYSKINNNIFQIISSRENYKDKNSLQNINISELKTNIEKLIKINSEVDTKNFKDEEN